MTVTYWLPKIVNQSSLFTRSCVPFSCLSSLCSQMFTVNPRITHQHGSVSNNLYVNRSRVRMSVVLFKWAKYKLAIPSSSQIIFFIFFSNHTTDKFWTSSMYLWRAVWLKATHGRHNPSVHCPAALPMWEFSCDRWRRSPWFAFPERKKENQFDISQVHWKRLIHKENISSVSSLSIAIVLSKDQCWESEEEEDKPRERYAPSHTMNESNNARTTLQLFSVDRRKRERSASLSAQGGDTSI